MANIFEQIAVLNEGVMRASQLNERKQDAEKVDKTTGTDKIAEHALKQNL